MIDLNLDSRLVWLGHVWPKLCGVKRQVGPRDHYRL